MDHDIFSESSTAAEKAFNHNKKIQKIDSEFFDSVDTVRKYIQDGKFKNAARSVTNVQIVLNRWNVHIVGSFSKLEDYSESSLIKMFLRITKRWVSHLETIGVGNFDHISDMIDTARDSFDELVEHEDFLEDSDYNKYEDKILNIVKLMNSQLYRLKSDLMSMPEEDSK